MTDPVSREYRGNALILTVDNPPVNVISQAVRASLLAACAEAKAALEAGRIERVVVTGAGRSFVAGADAKEFDGPALDPQLPDVLNALAELPAIAAINGAALGGGYEIALACRYRIAAPAAMIGLPEVTLGVVPGSGGTQRLPRLIGLDKALPLISTGAVLKGKAALAQGMVDALAEDPLDAALALDLSNLGPAIADLPAPAAAPEAAQAARDTAKKRMRGQIAPLKAIELMEHAATLPLPEGMAAERAAFLDLRAGEQARALRHIFFAERGAGASAELKKLDPAPVDHVLVAGGGTMGAAIAYALNSAGIEITLLENDAEAETRARANVQKLFDEAVSRGKLDAAESIRRKSETFHFISGADTPLPPVDMVIEAVFENLDVKRALFTRLAAGLPEDTILATNTSYLDVNRIAEVVSNPSRFLGLHFFAPAHLMKLVEVIRAEGTSKQTLATAFALTKRLNKIAVEAGVCDGFIGNRILTRYRQTADVTLLEGALPAQVDKAATGFGMAMGPYAVQDLSGLDIAYANRKRKRDAGEIFKGRYVPVADRMVEDLKRLGRKTGAGWYDYQDGKPVASEAVDDEVRRASSEAGVTRRDFSAAEIARRLALSMIAEGADIVAEGIANRPADVDLVLVHGYGFPRWRGGPMRLADEWGLPALLAEYEALAAEDPKSWAVPALIRTLVSEGKGFADLN
ncbi:MAG TPA: 3-hydroxyacyl-CoA dehydrogenase NAD-binding domain-containing protein [Paracoccus sp. (in: a-proteobacteria)]|uniref:3-hydroxyacyl-CoA dehydrogenase NAD-binding domain-containing protein n=1 Tax=uncultured Paracoccus sp. TaxID=189685 RepID=UPI002607F7FB|nr:3-hydroxyacyl-CoA dehydrogenase NAD-binding domain-containing protein [uncultured Paracoccus sp.]HMQ41751.1 3-hydroxyacyl-CoA dehydrogenase NAD-binding domain-containing protein [Paracoccus sp. (in: a-proteobacteria)]HMR37301.1 3-hydroxyacyl-CoA dehydrogenase NAD-binding domain-containing protein [Paracoccus sp. (in: a-proteobacteria)]